MPRARRSHSTARRLPSSGAIESARCGSTGTSSASSTNSGWSIRGDPDGSDAADLRPALQQRAVAVHLEVDAVVGETVPEQQQQGAGRRSYRHITLGVLAPYDEAIW